MVASLSIILVNYGRSDLTIDCVRSLEESTYEDFKVIIVDNDATEDSTGQLKAGCPEAIVIPSEKNLGFAEGNNVGIRQALAIGSEFILLLNNDTLVRKDLLSKLVQTAKGSRLVGVVGGKIYYHDSPETLWFAGGHLEIDKALGTHLGIGNRDNGSFDHATETDYVTGCCMLTKREVFENTGLLDTRLFLYFEDADFCVRARNSGYVILFQPEAVLYHRVSISTRHDSPVYIYFNLRNKIIFLRKHSTFRKWARHLPYLAYFYFRQIMRLLLKSHDLRGTRAACLGLWDGLRNHTGQAGEGNLYRL